MGLLVNALSNALNITGAVFLAGCIATQPSDAKTVLDHATGSKTGIGEIDIINGSNLSSLNWLGEVFSKDSTIANFSVVGDVIAENSIIDDFTVVGDTNARNVDFVNMSAIGELLTQHVVVAEDVHLTSVRSTLTNTEIWGKLYVHNKNGTHVRITLNQTTVRGGIVCDVEPCPIIINK